MQFLFVGLAMLAGLSNPIQSAANAALNKALGHPLIAASVIYAIALTGLLLCGLITGLPLRGAGARFAGIPWWAYAGGLCNLVFVLAGATATQKIGSAAFTVTTLVTAVILSIILDKYGLLGLPMREATWPRLVGAVLAIGGVTMVSLF